jgi:Phasin protein
MRVSFTEANVKAAFDHAQKLIYAKDPQELIAPQSEYVEEAARRHGGACKGLGVAVLKKMTPDM